jgi:uncharacterized membrane protein YesL
MFGFLIKKAFFDMWDHFLGIVIMNLGYVAVITVPVLLSGPAVQVSVLLFFFVVGVGIILFFLYSGAVAMATREIANYQAPEFKKFLSYFKETWKSSLILGLIFCAVALVLQIGIPVYASMNNLLGFAAIVFLGWAIIIWFLASQYYLPIRAQLDDSARKILRKSFVIFFDNTFFSILLGIGSLLIAVGSVFTALLIPGVTGLMLWHQVGLKLRLYKYDYLEENPDANRRKIPWDALLIDDEDRVGKRTLRGMIFPWKE